MKLRLNIATAPLDNKRPFLAGVGVLGTIGLVALLFLSHAAFKSWRANRNLRVEISRWEGQIHASRQKQVELDQYFHTQQVQQVLDRAAFLNSLIGERSFPWTKIFMDLEPTLPAGVRVVSISPKLENGRALVTLTIGASTDDAKIKFLESLEKSPAFSGIQVTEERHQDQTPASDRIVVQLTAWYATT